MRISKFLLFASHSQDLESDFPGHQNVVFRAADGLDDAPIVDDKGDPIRCFVQHQGDRNIDDTGLEYGYGNLNFYNEGQTNTATITAVTSSASAYITGSQIMQESDYVFLLGSNYS